MTTDRLRKLLALVLATVPLIAVATALALADLPDPVPSHWDASGAVNGTTGAVPFTLITLALTGGSALAAIGFARTARPRYGVVACAFAAYLVGALGVLTVVAASGAATAQEVELPLLSGVGAIAAALLGPALCWVLWPAPGPAGPVAGPADQLPRLDLTDDERVVYVADVRSRGFAWLAVGCGLIGLVVAVTADLLIGASLLAVTVTGAMLQRATVRADANGLRVDLGPVVRVRVPLADIRQAQSQELRPMEWGGWGYRVLPNRRAVILRGGPGLVLDLADGSRFAVTLDQPDEAAAVLNGLLHRSRQG